MIASDRRYPTVNAYGPLYGSTEYSTDVIPVLDPVKNTVSSIVAPVRDDNIPEALGPGHAASDKLMQPSPYWGGEKLWDTKANNHNGMIDRKGRVWFAISPVSSNILVLTHPTTCPPPLVHNVSLAS